MHKNSCAKWRSGKMKRAAKGDQFRRVLYQKMPKKSNSGGRAGIVRIRLRLRYGAIAAKHRLLTTRTGFAAQLLCCLQNRTRIRTLLGFSSALSSKN